MLYIPAYIPYICPMNLMGPKDATGASGTYGTLWALCSALSNKTELASPLLSIKWRWLACWPYWLARLARPTGYAGWLGCLARMARKAGCVGQLADYLAGQAAWPGCLARAWENPHKKKNRGFHEQTSFVLILIVFWQVQVPKTIENRRK